MFPITEEDFWSTRLFEHDRSDAWCFVTFFLIVIQRWTWSCCSDVKRWPVFLCLLVERRFHGYIKFSRSQSSKAAQTITPPPPPPPPRLTVLFMMFFSDVTGQTPPCKLIFCLISSQDICNSYKYFRFSLCNIQICDKHQKKSGKGKILFPQHGTLHWIEVSYSV